MASSFPNSVDQLREDFTDATANQTNAPDWQNFISQAVKAVQTKLGVGTEKPNGNYATVGLRLNTVDFNRAINGKGVVKHGNNAAIARPTGGYASYEWIGSVAPNNAADGDTWIQT